jgi:hypothetical protein
MHVQMQITQAQSYFQQAEKGGYTWPMCLLNIFQAPIRTLA